MSTMIISPQVPHQGLDLTKLTSITWSMGLLHTFNSMRLNGEMCDVRITLENQGTLNAHSCVLAGASPFLKSLLLGTDNPEINMESFPGPVVKEILEFIYTGTATVKREDLFVFHSVSAMLNLTTLTEMAVKLMQNNVAKNKEDVALQPGAQEAPEVPEEIERVLTPTKLRESESKMNKRKKKDESTVSCKDSYVLLQKLPNEKRKRNVKTPRTKSKPVVEESPRKSSRTRKPNTFLKETFETTFQSKKRKRKEVEPEPELEIIEIKEEIVDDETEQPKIILDEVSGVLKDLGAPEQDKNYVGLEGKEFDYSQMPEVINSALAQIDSMNNLGDQNNFMEDDVDENNDEDDVPAPSMHHESHPEANEPADDSLQVEQRLVEASTAADDMMATDEEVQEEVLQPSPIQVVQRKGGAYVLESVVPKLDCYVEAQQILEPQVEPVGDDKLPDLDGKGVYVKKKPGPKLPQRRSIHGIAFANTNDVPKHEGVTFMCEVCQRCFTDQDYFERHRERHINKAGDNDDPERRFACSYCPYKAKYKALLQEHERTHTGEKPYECGTCGRKFSHKKSWRIHEEQHTGKKYPCKFCNKVFNLWNNHHKHVKLMHTDCGRYHKCPVCSKTFKQATCLKRHLATHSLKREYQCPHCPKAYFDSKTLGTHVRNKHLGTGTKYRCVHCGKEYLCKLSIQKHVCKSPEEMKVKAVKKQSKKRQKLIAEGAIVVESEEIQEDQQKEPEPPKSNFKGTVVNMARRESDGETSGDSDLDLASDLEDLDDGEPSSQTKLQGSSQKEEIRATEPSYREENISDYVLQDEDCSGFGLVQRQSTT